MNINRISSYNYLVPADGTTHAVTYSGTLVAPILPPPIDWHSFQQNNFPFRPQGAKLDNTLGSEPLVLSNLSTGETSSCPVGATRWVSFVSTAQMQQQVSGNGAISIQFVDFPVIETAPVDATGAPIASSGGESVSVSNFPTTQAVSGSVSVSNLPTTQAVSGSVSISNIPAIQLVSAISNKAALLSGAFSAEGTTTIGTPPTNTNMRLLRIDVTGNVAQATAGVVTVTIVLDDATVAVVPFYVPDTSGALGNPPNFTFDFTQVAFNAGSGILTCTLSDAFTSGALYINAYFD